MKDPEALGAREVRESVSAAYGRAVTRSGSCCGGDGAVPAGVTALLAGYPRAELALLPPDAVRSSFGCGNPLALAAVREGDTVLDLGSGAGIDLLLAAKLVGPRGRVIGVDMTPEMIARARENARAAGLDNVEVRQGIIEALPVPDASIDLVISNCVINLSPEKPRVFAEIARVLRPGGRISISDMVVESMPDWVRGNAALRAACVAGAIPEADYLAGLRAVGLQDVAVQDRLVYTRETLEAVVGLGPGDGCCGAGDAGGVGGIAPFPPADLHRVLDALAGQVASIRVVGRKKTQPNTQPNT